jgi:DNA-binding Xre family transcriptional regulator
MLRSNVKELMLANGVSIRGLEQATGLSTRTIQNARADAGVAGCSLSTLDRIARALGCSIHDLFDDDPDQGPADAVQGKD